MNKFICSECGTKYSSPELTPPPSIKWDDGHVCTIVPVDSDKDPKKVIKDFVNEEYPNAIEAIKEFLVEALWKYHTNIIDKKWK